MKRRLVLVAGGLAALTLLSGCAGDPLAEQYLKGGTQNYISGSGTITETKEAERGEPISFEGVTDGGVTIARSDYEGEVLVVNFWYAACPPCRKEAPDLVALAKKYEGNGATFLGVNIYDGPEQSQAFARKFEVPYPSFLDDKTGKVRLAFAGQIAPNAVPTTFVLDKQGRVTARILGIVDEPSILDTLISDAIAEGTQ